MVRAIKNDIFLKACRRLPTPRTPVWIMRQAGRYLPEYRAVREKVDFLTLCKTPELVSQVTIQPVDILDVDAAIIFSDIMMVPEAMGMKFDIIEAKGPVFEYPIRSAAEIDALALPDPTDKLKYVLEAVSLTKRELRGRVPLIGFCGAPWTLFSYMVEGASSKNFRFAKVLVYSDPLLAHKLLEKITRVVIDYLKAQVEAGADVLQIFDSWGGSLAKSDFLEFSLKYIKEIMDKLSSLDVPVIVFAKDCSHSLSNIAGTGCDVVAIDWRTDIKVAKEIIGRRVAIQGNLDPLVLYARPERIREKVRHVLEGYGRGEGHIFNLGHGIPPDVPVEHVKALVQFVKEESPRYHMQANRK